MFLLLIFALASSVTRSARADSTQLPTGPTPVIWVALTSGTLTVHTWDQPQVQIDGDSSIEWRHVGTPRVGARLPAQIPLWSQTIQTQDGPMMLPAEVFVLPPLGGTEHDAIIGRGSGNATITIPSGTALLVTNVNRGSVNIDNYRGGVFVTHMHNGRVDLENVSGTGAVQIASGPFSAVNSQFTRLRVRTARGNILLRNCTSQQIEATSLLGSILYDNGSFEPGLARFETEHGDIALGVAGGNVQIGAHSAGGKIYSGFPGGDANVSIGPNDGQVTVGSGGPIVTATSGSGAVMLYHGSLNDHPELQSHWPRRPGFNQQMHSMQQQMRPMQQPMPRFTQKRNPRPPLRRDPN